jgi:hypothetical protein
MTGFDLPANFHNNPESLLRRRVRQKTIHGQRPVPSTLELGSTSTSQPTPPMAKKTIHDFSVPSSNNIPVGPDMNVGEGFELRQGVIHMVQASPIYRLESKDANSHLQQFLRYAAHLPSRMQPPMQFDFAFSCSH